MRDYRLHLDDIVEAIKKIEEYTVGMTFEEFSENQLVIDAVVRNLEIIGESCRAIPEDVKRQYSDIEWRKIVDFRNILIHQYFGVDVELVWDVVRNKIPELEIKIKEVKRELDAST